MKTLKGFTVAELLVVIVIITLMITILLPAFTTAANKETSFRAVCANRLKNLGMANSIYANEYDGYYCPLDFLDPNDRGRITMGIPPQNYDEIMWLANRGFRNILKYDQYPKNKRNSDSSAAYNGPLNMPAELLCPADKISIDWSNQRDGVLVSYGYNMTDWPYSWSGPLALSYMGYRVDNVPAPSTKLVFIDSIDWWVTWGCRAADPALAWDRHGQMSIGEYRGQGRGAGITSCYGPTIYRHNEGANITFYDGHVQYMKKQQIFVKSDYYDSSSGRVLSRPYQRPGMWVVDFMMYCSSHSALCGDGF